MILNMNIMTKDENAYTTPKSIGHFEGTLLLFLRNMHIKDDANASFNTMSSVINPLTCAGVNSRTRKLNGLAR